MTDEIVMQKARELAAAEAEAFGNSHTAKLYLDGYNDQHASMIALRKHLREVSDAVEEIVSVQPVWENGDATGKARVRERATKAWTKLRDFILPKPKPDPLVEAMKEVWPDYERVLDGDYAKDAERLRAALAAQGINLEGGDGIVS